MIILSANKLTKAYGTDVILEDVSFSINQGDRVGIIGRNGAGKTTLLSMLTKEMTPSSGDFFVGQNIRLGYLKQRDNFIKEDTVIKSIDNVFKELHELEKRMDEVKDWDELSRLQEEYERKGGYQYKSEMIGVLTSMGFPKEEYEKKISELSGGERTRLALAALLLEKPDILMLDEPTNHLDIDTLRWLEQYLSSYKGTIIIVTHDRYFLDKVVNRIFEVENHHLYTYKGKYSDYAEQKRIRRETEMRAYINQEKEIRRQEDIIRIMKEHNTEHLVKRAQSREKRLEMIDRLEKPEAELGKMKFSFKEKFKSGNDVVTAEDLSKSLFDRKPYRELFHDVNFDIKRGEKICIVGPNGIGKTTLLRMILGELPATSGRIKLGTNVMLGYYDQGQQMLHDEMTVIEELQDAYHMYNDTEMRNILGRFLFRGDDVFHKVSGLSGGEKARLTLVKLILSGANTLILDEPTDHLDIESKEIFEEALNEFPGTAIIVTHDRYFLKKVPTRMLELSEDGVTEYLGKWEYYLEKKEEKEKAKKQEGESNKRINATDNNVLKNKDKGEYGISSEFGNEGRSLSSELGNEGRSLSSQEERQLKKQKEAEERRKKRELEKAETEIVELEEKIASLEKEMNMASGDYAKLTKLAAEHEELKTKLAETEKIWEELMS